MRPFIGIFLWLCVPQALIAEDLRALSVTSNDQLARQFTQVAADSLGKLELKGERKLSLTLTVEKGGPDFLEGLRLKCPTCLPVSPVPNPPQPPQPNPPCNQRMDLTLALSAFEARILAEELDETPSIQISGAEIRGDSKDISELKKLFDAECANCGIQDIPISPRPNPPLPPSPPKPCS